jgi:uncharacterized protein YuzE
MVLVLETRVELQCEYDAEADTLYAWTGDKPRAAITYETDEGHLIRLDPDTKEFVGVTIFDFRASWQDKPICLDWEVEVEQRQPWIPWIARRRREHVKERRVLHRTSGHALA